PVAPTRPVRARWRRGVRRAWPRPSALDLDDGHREGAAGRLVAHLVTHLGPHQRLAERRHGGDDVDVVALLLDRADEVALGVLVVLVDDRHDRPAGHRVGDLALVDGLGDLHERLEVADAGLGLALLLLGRVVVAVLLQVAHLPGGLDLAGDLDAPLGGEVLVLLGEAVEGLLAEEVRLSHRARVATGSRRGNDTVQRLWWRTEV